jgi:hypothetical protein
VGGSAQAQADYRRKAQAQAALTIVEDLQSLGRGSKAAVDSGIRRILDGSRPQLPDALVIEKTCRDRRLIRWFTARYDALMSLDVPRGHRHHIGASTTCNGNNTD